MKKIIIALMLSALFLSTSSYAKVFEIVVCKGFADESAFSVCHEGRSKPDTSNTKTLWWFYSQGYRLVSVVGNVSTETGYMYVYFFEREKI